MDLSLFGPDWNIFQRWIRISRIFLYTYIRTLTFTNYFDDPLYFFCPPAVQSFCVKYLQDELAPNFPWRCAPPTLVDEIVSQLHTLVVPILLYFFSNILVYVQMPKTLISANISCTVFSTNSQLPLLTLATQYIWATWRTKCTPCTENYQDNNSQIIALFAWD